MPRVLSAGKVFRSFGAVCLALGAAAGSASAQSILNSSFDVAGAGGSSGSAGDRFANFDEYVRNTIASTTNCNNNDYPGRASSSLARTGASAVTFAATPINCRAGLSQTVSGFTVGASYQLSFYAQRANSSPAQDNIFEVFVGGSLASTDGVFRTFNGGTNIYSQAIPTPTASPTDYIQLFTTTFVATDASLLLRLEGANAGSNFQIDDISFQQITAVPEPSTYMLMAAGLGVLGVVARRRKRAA